MILIKKLNKVNQIIETTDKDKFEMYNLLSKDVLIGMLIECNKHLQRLSTPRIENNTKPFIEIVSGNCGFYMAGLDTSGKCNNCGKQQWEH